jgi:PBP1b-binding outer membrane lipoprotein LpoB
MKKITIAMTIITALLLAGCASKAEAVAEAETENAVKVTQTAPTTNNAPKASSAATVAAEPVHEAETGIVAFIEEEFEAIEHAGAALFGKVKLFLADVEDTTGGFFIYSIPILLILAFIYLLLFGKIGLLKKDWRLAEDQA